MTPSRDLRAGWIAVAFVSLVMSVIALFQTRTSPEPIAAGYGVLQTLDTSNTIRAGYGVYPPYTQEDPATKKLDGFSVDVLEEIARQLGARVEWRRLNWSTMAADLKRGSFDIVSDPIFQTIPRAREFYFSNPYAYFADGIVVVRSGENRFSEFDDLDRPEVTIAVAKGIASDTLLRSRFKRARIQSVAISNDTLLPFNEVLSGRADAAVSDGPDASRFANEHKGKVKVLFLDKPPAYMPAGFALRFGDQTGLEFINVSIRNLETTGVTQTLARKYGITSYRVPGQRW